MLYTSQVRTLNRPETKSEHNYSIQRERCLMTHSRFLDDREGHGNLLLPVQGYKDCPLLPLEEAVKPIIHLCENLLANVCVIKKRCETIVDDVLSIDELASIQLYTTEWVPSENTVYYQLNHVLRSKERVLCSIPASYKD
ncbi:unnamed protein product [Didymodactylos carnosus]|uniref:Uncharacterized protein n=1 Tax=Didymodactylos carnosus TaxID=1234261 RepID=A0A814FEL5_9BILA|nr:unnamed protein product [Didymodactylos carnosus]CAF3752882.1 unnamed protein product [Didymodactylos carnosus]